MTLHRSLQRFGLISQGFGNAPRFNLQESCLFGLSPWTPWTLKSFSLRQKLSWMNHMLPRIGLVHFMLWSLLVECLFLQPSDLFFFCMFRKQASLMFSLCHWKSVNPMLLTLWSTQKDFGNRFWNWDLDITSSEPRSPDFFANLVFVLL